MILSICTSILGLSAAWIAIVTSQPNMRIGEVGFSKRHRKSVKFFKLADAILEDVSQAVEAAGSNRGDARAHLPLVVGALKRGEMMQRRKSFSTFVSSKKIESYLNRLKAEELRLNLLPKFSSYEEFMREVA